MEIDTTWLDTINEKCRTKGYTLRVMASYKDWSLPACKTVEEREALGASKLREIDEDYCGERAHDIGIWPNGVPDETAVRHQAMMVIDLIEQGKVNFSKWATDAFICMLVYRRSNLGPTECKTAILTVSEC